MNLRSLERSQGALKIWEQSYIFPRIGIFFSKMLMIFQQVICRGKLSKIPFLDWDLPVQQNTWFVLYSIIPYKELFFSKTDQKKCISINLASLLILLTQKLKVSSCWLPHSGNTCAPHAQFLFMSNCMASCSVEPTFPFGICTPSPSLDEDPVASENSAAVCPNR